MDLAALKIACCSSSLYRNSEQSLEGRTHLPRLLAAELLTSDRARGSCRTSMAAVHAQTVHAAVGAEIKLAPGACGASLTALCQHGCQVNRVAPAKHLCERHASAARIAAMQRAHSEHRYHLARHASALPRIHPAAAYARPRGSRGHHPSAHHQSPFHCHLSRLAFPLAAECTMQPSARGELHRNVSPLLHCLPAAPSTSPCCCCCHSWPCP